MINLKTKADENYDAFVLLKDNGKLNSSIHCAYYSAFLLSIYSLCVRFGYLYEDIQNNSRGKDNHAYIRNELGNKIHQAKPLDYVEFHTCLGKLKKEREKADYSKNLVTNKDVVNIQDTIDKFRDLIITKYI